MVWLSLLLTVIGSDTQSLRVPHLPVEPALRNDWPDEMEAEYWTRANAAIRFYADGKPFGNTYFENEFLSYPKAMFEFLGGDRKKAVDFLTQPDHMSKDNAHTLGVDLYPAPTLLYQTRKYFYFGNFMPLAAKRTIRDAAKAWTKDDPLGKPHPIHKTGKGSGGWGPDARGSWVDVRNTEHYARMRDSSVYLFAEEAGNDATARKYKARIKADVVNLYYEGARDWDSELSLPMTVGSFLNLYDFAKDREIRLLAKAALDLYAASGAHKYFRAGYGGPSRREGGGGNVVFGSPASSLLHLWFGDSPLPDPEPDRTTILAITSGYRPPIAVVRLARKSSGAGSETYGFKSNGSSPGYSETARVGATYALGTVTTETADLAVQPFKLIATNSKRGAVFLVVNRGEPLTPGTRPGDQIAQAGAMLTYLRESRSGEPISFQAPMDATFESGGEKWFIKFEKTWVAILPINLVGFAPAQRAPSRANAYERERALVARAKTAGMAGFAMIVSEAPQFATFDAFRKAVRETATFELKDAATGLYLLKMKGVGELSVRYTGAGNMPILSLDGKPRDWSDTAYWASPNPEEPISMARRSGRLKVEAGGAVFECSVSREGSVSFTNS
jgi:hypothetical protein